MKHRRNIKFWGLALAAVFAFSAVSVANAAAASHFKASGTGTLSGAQTGNQVFNTGAGEVTCTKAATSGTVSELEATHQKVTVKYSGCTAFGFASVEISPAEYNLLAEKKVEILNTITINVPLAGCHVTVGPQGPLSTVTYVNKTGKIEEVSNVAGIASEGSGGSCGGKNTTGTYKGNNLAELVGGTIEWVE